MKLWRTLRDAVSGWIAIGRGSTNWQQFFTLSAPGFATALALFLLFAFLALVLLSAGRDLPALPGILAALLVQSLSVLALVVSVFATRAALRSPVPPYALLVPGVYALIFYLLFGSLLAAAGGPVLMLAWLAAGFLFYRLGRMAGGWTRGVSLAFAVLTVVLLVGAPIALYMGLNPPPSPS